jgi:hypothetical protein
MIRPLMLLLALLLALAPQAEQPLRAEPAGEAPSQSGAAGPTLPRKLFDAPPPYDPSRAGQTPAEEIPTPPGQFPALPPDPNLQGEEALPPLEEELWLHGGSHLYAPEGDAFHYRHHDGACEENDHVQVLRLPEDWVAPQPFTMFADFLGADPIRPWPGLSWPGAQGFQMEPRLVIYGRYDLFGLAFEQGNQRTDGIGHQLLADIDLRLTGTERLHMQFRPLGKGNTGGSLLQLNDPVHYIDNSTGIPQRYWFEFELQSVTRGITGNEFLPLDYHITAGKFPFALHNALLINDEIVGVVLNKNTVYLGDLSNLNLQTFYAFDDVNTAAGFNDLLGVNATADYRHWFFEMTYAHVFGDPGTGRDTDYAAFSATQFFGPATVAARSLFKWGDRGGIGSGQLYVLETNYARTFHNGLARGLGIHHGVFYANAFYATPGWQPISGGNFDRLTSTFEVNPLVQIARGALNDTPGVALGVQLFRHNEDQSLTPEVAFQAPGGQGVIGAGLRFQQKTSARSFFELRTLGAWSRDPTLEQYGIFAQESIFF